MTPYQKVVLLSQRRRILVQMHDAKMCAHFCVTKTLNKIRQKHYWSGLHSDVRTNILGCYDQEDEGDWTWILKFSLARFRLNLQEKRWKHYHLHVPPRKTLRRVIRKITVPIQVFLSKKDLCRC